MFTVCSGMPVECNQFGCTAREADPSAIKFVLHGVGVDMEQKAAFCRGLRAGIAQLVEYKLPKLGVASSNLVARSS